MNDQSYRFKRPYTIFEVELVLLILVILSYLGSHGVRNAIMTKKRASTFGAAYNLRSGVASYYTEYRRLPVTGLEGDEFIDLKSDETIMDIITGAKTKIGIDGNPQSIAFYLARNAKKLDSDRFINGIHRAKDGSGTLWDPFGRLYGIRLDVSNRGSVPNPAITPPNLGGGSESPQWGQANNHADTPDIISDSVIIWSSGKDLKIASDNITTW